MAKVTRRKMLDDIRRLASEEEPVKAGENSQLDPQKTKIRYVMIGALFGTLITLLILGIHSLKAEVRDLRSKLNEVEMNQPTVREQPVGVKKI